MIFQVGISEILKYNLETRSLGKFSFLVDGRPHGFFRNRGYAETAFGKQLAAEHGQRQRAKWHNYGV